jgi:hypothetical protein
MRIPLAGKRSHWALDGVLKPLLSTFAPDSARPFRKINLTVAIIVHLQERNFADKKMDRSSIFHHHAVCFGSDRQRLSR